MVGNVVNIFVGELAFFIDNKKSTLADAVAVAIGAVLFCDFSLRMKVAQEIVRKSTEALGPGGVARDAVNRYTQDLGIIAFEAFEVGLVRRHLRRSDRRPGQRIKRQHYIVLATEV